MNKCTCEVCRLHDQLAAALKERDEYKRQAVMWASVVDRQGLTYAEHVQIVEFDRRVGGGGAG